MKLLKLLFTMIVIAAAFAGGFVVRAVNYEKSAVTSRSGERRILYYRDPMHPAYTSDKPGIAPDCGMQLEAVYDDAPSGAVNISPQIQQMMGIAVEQAREGSGSFTLRLLGHVATDET